MTLPDAVFDCCQCLERGTSSHVRKSSWWLSFLLRSNTSLILTLLSNGLLPLAGGERGKIPQHHHCIAYFKSKFEIIPDKTISYIYRHFTDEGAEKFQNWIASYVFEGVFSSDDVNIQLESFLRALGRKMDEFFPMRTTIINPHMKALIRKRRRVYHREGRSVRL